MITYAICLAGLAVFTVPCMVAVILWLKDQANYSDRLDERVKKLETRVHLLETVSAARIKDNAGYRIHSD